MHHRPGRGRDAFAGGPGCGAHGDPAVRDQYGDAGVSGRGGPAGDTAGPGQTFTG